MLADVSYRTFVTLWLSRTLSLIKLLLTNRVFFVSGDLITSDPNLRPSFSELTVALKPLQRLVTPSNMDQPSSPLQQGISVNSIP